MSATDCLDEDTLLGLVEGGLDAQTRRLAAAHVDECGECRVVAAALARDLRSARATLPHWELPGALGQRYELLRRIRLDRIGAVFAANDRKRNEVVGMRWIRPELLEGAATLEAVRGAVLAMRSIDYPNIARVASVEQEGPAVVIVGELVEGETLSEVLAGGPLDPKRAMDVVLQLTAALAAAHRHGLVHGDLGPESVVLDLANHVSVTDFGLALALFGAPAPSLNAVRRIDAVALSNLGLRLLREGGREQEEMRAAFERCAEGDEELRSAVELEAAAREVLDVQRSPVHVGEDTARTRWIPGPGELIGGRYRVEGLVGSGGMSIVLAARQLDLDRRVAVKLMPPRAARRRSAVERFLREARAASAIDSEHVARIFDVGRSDDGTPYMAMEFLAGVTLGRLLKKRGPLPVADTLSYVLQACVTVAECHARGIIHRDLKPDNIMVLERPGQRGFVKVLDFGISKTDWLDERSAPDLTATTDLLGTPTYMSPEQVRSSKTVDQRTDIWAFGVMLYELLTGTTPFAGDSIPAVAARIVSDAPKPPRELRPDLPETLSSLILWCLEKDPAKRPGSVRELAESLAPLAPPNAAVSLARIRQITRESVRPPPSVPSNPIPLPPPEQRASPVPPRAPTPVPPRPPTPVPPRAPTPIPPAPAPTPAVSTTWNEYLSRRSSSQRMGVLLGAGAVVLAIVVAGWLLSDDSEEPDVIPIASSATPNPAASGSATNAEPASHGEHERSPHGTAPRHSGTPGKSGPLEGRY